MYFKVLQGRKKKKRTRKFCKRTDFKEYLNFRLKGFLGKIFLEWMWNLL